MESVTGGRGPSGSSSADAPRKDFAGFVEALRSRVALLPDAPIERGSKIDDICGGNRLLRALILGSIESMADSPPSELVSTIQTFGEAHDWIATRAPGASVRKATTPTDNGEVRLRPVLPEDIVHLYRAAVDPARTYRWRYRGATPSLPAFSEQIGAGVLAHFVAEVNATSSLAGYLVCYNYAPADQTASFALTRVAPPSAGGRDGMFAALFMFISYVFRHWPLRQLYAEIPAFNWEQFAGGRDGFFRVVGESPAKVFYDQTYWTEYLICIDLPMWQEVERTWGAVVFGHQ